MNLRRIIALVLIVALVLPACGKADTPAAPDDTMVKKDIADYITEILDSTASITAFERLHDTYSDSNVTVDCKVTYSGDMGEYTIVFSPEYHYVNDAWSLVNCTLKMLVDPEESTGDTAPTTVPAPSTDPVPSTGPDQTDPLDTTPPETDPSQTEPKNRWKISHSSKTLQVGESFTLQVKNQNGTAADVTWRAGKSGIVSISGNRITAVSEGKTELSCSVDGQTFRCTVTVKPKPVDPSDDVPDEPAPSTSPSDPPVDPTPSEPPADTTPSEPPADTTPSEPPVETTCPPLPPVTPEDDPIEGSPPSPEDPPVDEGTAPAGYSIRLSPKEVYVYQTFYVTVTPDVPDYTKIVIHAIDPTGGRWDFVISSGNSYDLMVTELHLTGTWTIYADVYNDYGVFYGASSGAKATLTVYPLPI